MGWTSYHADYYKKNGAVDRKKECDAYFLEGLNRGHYAVEKSVMKGSVYYAAVRALKKYTEKKDGKPVYEDIAGEQTVWAVVILTSTNKKDYFNFSYKVMDETAGPCYYDCPKSILDLLSPASNEWAEEWRRKCRARLEDRKNGRSLSKLPVGTKIRFKHNGAVVQLTKCGPAYQFRTPFWYNGNTGTYYPKKYIPDDFEIVEKNA